MDKRAFRAAAPREWSLRTKLLLMLMVIVVGLLGLLYGLSRIVLVERFGHIEREAVTTSLSQIDALLEADTTQLAMLVADWAARENTYHFVTGADPTYLRDNVSPEMFKRLGIDLIVFLDAAGKPVFSQARRPSDGMPQRLDPADLAALARLDRTPRAGAQTSEISGLTFLDEQPLLVAAHTIEAPRISALPGGTLVFGRLLTPERLAALGGAGDPAVRLLRLDDPALPPSVRADATDHRVHVAGRDHVEGFSVLSDVFGTPAAALKVTLPRSVYAQSRQILDRFLLCSLVAGALCSLVTAFLINRLFLARLARMRQSVRRIAQTNDPSARIPVSGHDELSELAETLNHAFAALQQSQETLAESQQQLQQILTSISDSILRFDVAPDGTASNLWLSAPQFKAITGHDGAWLQANPDAWRDLVHPDDHAQFTAFLERLSTGHDAESEYRILAASGDTVWLRDSGHVEPLPGGAGWRVFRVLSDITGRKTAEEALRTSQERLARVLEGSGDGWWDWDFRTNTVAGNERWAEMLGYAPEEIDPDFENWKTLIHPDDLGRVMAALDRHVKGETSSYECEYRLRSKAGEWRWVLDRGILVTRDEDGRPLRMAGTHTDITARKAAAQALEESEAKIRSILAAIPDLMFRLDREGRYIDIHAGNAEGLYAPPAEDAIGQRVTDLLPAEVAQIIMDRIAAAFSSGEIQVFTYELPFATGPRRFESRLVVSGPDEVLMIVRDITARAEAEAERERLLKEMEARATEMATVAEISLRATRILNIDHLLPTVADLTRDTFDLYQAHIFLLDATGTQLELAAGAGEVGRMLVRQHHSIPLDHPQSVVARAARTRTSAVINDTRTATDCLPNPLLPLTQSELAIPMIAGGELLGVLDVQSIHAGRFAITDVNVMTTLAAQVAIAIQNARLFTENERRLAIIENSTESIALASLKETPYHPIYVNRAGLELVGMDSAAEFCSHPVTHYYDAPSVDRLAAEAIPAALSSGLWRGESTIRRQDGTLVPVAQTLFVIRDEDGTPRDLATIMTDISDRKAGEEALRRANRAYRILSNCNQAIVRAGDEANLLWQICQIMSAEGGYPLVWAGIIEPEGGQVIPAGSAGDETVAEAITGSCGAEGCPCERALSSRQIHIVADLAAVDRSQSAWVATAVERGFTSALVLPLLDELEAPFGVLVLGTTQPGAFDDEELALLKQLASDLAFGLMSLRARSEREKALAARREQYILTEALRDTAEAINSSLDPEIVIDRILDNLKRVVPHDAADIILVEGDSSRLVRARQYTEQDPIEPAGGVTPLLNQNEVVRRVAASGKPLIVPHTQDDPDWAEYSRWAASFACAPVRREGNVIGLISVYSVVPHFFKERHAERLQAFADQAAIALQNASLYEAAQRHADELQAQARRLAVINRVSTRLAQTLDIDQIYRIIMDETQAVLGADFGSLVIFEGNEVGRVVFGTHPDDRKGCSPELPLAGNASVDLVRQTHRPLASEDVLHDPLFELAHPILRARGTRSLIIAPLVVGAEVIGTLGLDFKRPRRFTEAESELLNTLTSQASVAIAKAKLYDAERDQRILAEALRDTAATINNTLNIDEVLDRILDNVGRVVPHDAANVMLIDQGVARVERERGYAERGLSEWMAQLHYAVDEVPHWQHMLATGEPFAIPDTQSEPTWVPFEEERWIRSTVKAPIRLEGQSIGILQLDSETPNAFSQADAERLQAFADQAAIAIRNAQLFAAERDQRALAEALRDTAEVVNSSLDFNDVLEGILANVERIAPHHSATILLVEGDTARVARSHVVPPDPDIKRWIEACRFHVPSTENLRTMVETREPLAIADTETYPGWIRQPNLPWIRSQAAAPIRQDDRVIGFLTLDSLEPNFYTQEHAERLQAFADQVATAIRNAQLFAAEREQRTLAEALRDTAAALNSTLNFDELLDRILTNVGRVVPHDSANILLVENGVARAVRSQGYTEHGQENWVERWLSHYGNDIYALEGFR